MFANARNVPNTHASFLNLEALHLPVDHPGAALIYLTNGLPGVDEDRKVRGAKGYCMCPQRMRICKNALHYLKMRSRGISLGTVSARFAGSKAAATEAWFAVDVDFMRAGSDNRLPVGCTSV
jgi:hypothetical protein